MNRINKAYGFLLLVLMVALQLSMFAPKVVLATSDGSPEPRTQEEQVIPEQEEAGEEAQGSFTPTEDSLFEDAEDPLDPGIPEVSTDDISNWVDRKGFEIIGILQRFVQPFAIIVMIGCAFMTMLGAFGNPKLLSGGLLGMVIAMVIYVVVLYAPELMDIFLNWVRT